MKKTVIAELGSRDNVTLEPLFPYRFKVVIFDCDGVYFISTKRYLEIIQTAAKLAGVAAPTPEILKRFWGANFEQMLDLLAHQLGWTIEDLIRIEKTMAELEFDQRIPEVTLPFQLNENLLKMRKDGFFLATISHQTMLSLSTTAERVGFNVNIFNWVQTIDTHGYRQPDARVFDSLLEHLRLEEEIESLAEVVYIGDSINYDLKATLNHQPRLNFIGITSPMVRREEFMAAGAKPNLVFPSFNEALDFIRTKNISIFN